MTTAQKAKRIITSRGRGKAMALAIEIVRQLPDRPSGQLARNNRGQFLSKSYGKAIAVQEQAESEFAALAEPDPFDLPVPKQITATVSKINLAAFPRMRVDNVKPGEFVSPILSERAGRIAAWIIARGNAIRKTRDLTGRYTCPFEQRYKHVCNLALHKYPYRGPDPAWVSAGHLD